MCLVDFSDADIFDAPLEKSVGRTVAVPGSIGATHVWLLLTLLYSSSLSTVSRSSSASLFFWDVDDPLLEILMKLDDA